MTVTQIYELLNTITQEVTGSSEIVHEDLENVVDIGTAIFSATSVDNYVKSLINKVGKVVAVNRPYKPPYPNIKREAWEYGSVLQKLRCAIPEAQANPSWGLSSGDKPEQFEFMPPTVTTQFWNLKATYEIGMSFTEMQVKESFNSRSELMAFIGMIENAIAMSKTIKEKAMAERAINNFVGEKLHADNGVIHLVSEYNTAYDPATPITSATAIYSPEFLRFASVRIMLYKDRLKDASNIYNLGTIPTFTPDEYMHVVFNAEFIKSVEAYMQADTFHDQLVALPNFDRVNFWQGTGNENYSFEDTTTIALQSTSGGHNITQSYIVGVIFDRDGVMICNENPRVTTAYNARGEFINNFYKWDASMFNDLAENGLVFVLD